MKRPKVFFSFHYELDSWRASQIRNIGAIEGNPPATDNDWEKITHGGDRAIRRWIDEQLEPCDCTILLIGAKTAGRKWIDYEIERSWNRGKGIVAIHVHNLKDQDGKTVAKGRNPLDVFHLDEGSVKRKPERMSFVDFWFATALSEVVKVQDPSDLWGDSSSTKVYAAIKSDLSGWIEEAVGIREKHSSKRG